MPRSQTRRRMQARSARVGPPQKNAPLALAPYRRTTGPTTGFLRAKQIRRNDAPSGNRSRFFPPWQKRCFCAFLRKRSFETTIQVGAKKSQIPGRSIIPPVCFTLVAAPSRFALCEEGAGAFFEVVRVDERAEFQRFQGERIGNLQMRSGVDRALAGFDRTRRFARDRVRELLRRGQ